MRLVRLIERYLDHRWTSKWTEWWKKCMTHLSRVENIGSYIGLLEVIFAHFYKSARDNCKSFVSRTFWYELLYDLKRFIFFFFFFFSSRDNIKEADVYFGFSTWRRKREKILLDDDLFSTCGVGWTHLFFLLELIPCGGIVSGRFIYDSRSVCGHCMCNTLLTQDSQQDLENASRLMLMRNLIVKHSLELFQSINFILSNILYKSH